MARTKQTPRGRGRGRGLPVARREGNGNGNNGNGNGNGNNGNGNGNDNGNSNDNGNGNGSGRGRGTPPGRFVEQSENKPDPPVRRRKKPYVGVFQQIRKLQRTTKLCISKYQMTRSVFLKVFFRINIICPKNMLC